MCIHNNMLQSPCADRSAECRVDRKGLPDFGGLQNALSTKKTSQLVFFVFDLLWFKDQDFRPWALSVRKQKLEAVLADIHDDTVRFVEHHAVSGATMFASACKMGIEGIVSKNPDKRYVSGRAGQWTKTKCRPRQELVIGGWEMNGRNFASLMLGANRDGKFAYVGTAGTGFNGRNLPPLMDKLKKLEVDRSPFQAASPKKTSSIHFVRPEIVVEVAFETWTRSGKIRQASFKGVREDKKAEEIVVEVPNE